MLLMPPGRTRRCSRYMVVRAKADREGGFGALCWMKAVHSSADGLHTASL